MAKALISATNPFKPTAGAEPPHLIGRDEIVLAFEEGLAEGVGAPARLMRISGPRGSGKTVLLNDLAEHAKEEGWSVVKVSAGPGFMDDLVYGLSPRKAPVGFSAGANVVGISGSLNYKRKEPNLEDLMAGKAKEAKGLLIAIDEVQDADHGDMARIANTVQRLIGDKTDIALVFAGLPMGVADLINGKAMTFLRRALSEELTSINEAEVAISLRDSFEQTGFHVSDGIIEGMAAATKGYAYLIQLVGYYVWKRANRHRSDDAGVSERDVQEGVQIANDQFSQAVHEPAIAKLSKGAIEYLYAMAEDKVISSTAEVAKRMGKASKDTSSYRRTLLQREVIESPKRGYVQFAIPYLREYLLDNREDIFERY